MLDHIALQLDREGIKGREDGERSGGRRLFEGGKYFEIFPSKGGYYSREPIIRKALLFEEIRYLSSTVSSVCKGSTFK